MKTITTQWRALDRLIGGGFLRGKTSLLFGPPGNAKSFMAMNLLMNYMEERSFINCLYIPLEYRKLDHMKRAIAVSANSWKVVNESDAEDRAMVLDWLDNDPGVAELTNRLAGHIHENPSLASVTDQGDINIPIVDYGKVIDIVAKEAENRDFLIVDPITAIDPNDKARASEWDQQKQFVRSIGALADHHNCHIMLLSHSGKRQKHKGVVSSLTMDDAAGCAALTRFTQYALILDFHEKTNSRCYVGHGHERFDHTRTLIISKTNFGIGKGARIAMDFSETGPEMAAFGLIEEDEE